MSGLFAVTSSSRYKDCVVAVGANATFLVILSCAYAAHFLTICT